MKHLIILALTVCISHLNNINNFSKPKYIEYSVYLSSDVFSGPMVYTEKCIFLQHQKYSLAKIVDENQKLEDIKNEDDGFKIEMFPIYLSKIHYDYRENILEAQEYVVGKSEAINDYYLILDTIENIQWNITNQKKVIGGYNCIKATAEYRCRKYHAWFTPQIPINTGPWKLHGLPGLIVEAYDTDKRRLYQLNKISNEIPDSTIINEIEKKNVIQTLTNIELSQFYKKFKQRIKTINKIENSNVDCVDCPTTKQTYKLNLWECY